MSADNLRKLLIAELQVLYNAENQVLKALPKMAKAAHNEQLKSGIQSHLEETKGQVRRLEQAFHLLTEPAKSKPCPAMKSLLEESAEVIEDDKQASPARDAQLIGVALRIEHYEIAAYGSVRDIAEKMRREKIVGLLEQTLTEEGAMDKKLTKLAETVNAGALAYAETK